MDGLKDKIEITKEAYGKLCKEAGQYEFVKLELKEGLRLIEELIYCSVLPLEETHILYEKAHTFLKENHD